MRFLCQIVFFLMLIGLFCAPHAVGSGIPFSGNHTFDQLQRIYAEIPDTSDYLADYQQGLNQTPLNITNALYLGRASLKAGNTSEAERQFSFAIEKDRESKEAWRGLLVSLTLQEKYDELLNRSIERITLTPLDDEVWLDKGWALSEKGDASGALEAYKQVSAINPKNVFAPYYSAWAYGHLRQQQNAIKSYEKVSLLSPQYGGVSGNIAFLLLGMNNYGDAMGYLEKALDWYPNWTEARRSKGMVLYHLDRKDEAIKEWDEVLAIDANYTYVYLSKGEALKDMGRTDEALTTVDQGLLRSQNDTNLLELRGDVLISLNRYEEAMKTYEKVIAANQSGFDTVYSTWGKGYALEKQGRTKEAQEAYTQGLSLLTDSLTPNGPFYWHTKGLLLEGLGRSSDAKVAYIKAEELKYPKFFYL